MKAKIVQHPDLGEVQPQALTVYGQQVGQDWTDVEFTPEQAAKIRNNRFFAVKGEKRDPLDHDQNGKKGGSADLTGAGYEAQTVPELKALAADRNVDLGDATKKGDIIAALQLADEAQAQA